MEAGLRCVVPRLRLFCVYKIQHGTRNHTGIAASVRLKAIMPRSDSEDDSSKRKLIYDGSKGKWSAFNQEVTVHTMSSEVQTALWNGEAVEIADHDDPKDYDKYFKHGFSKAAAESAAAGNRYRTIEKLSSTGQ